MYWCVLLTDIGLKRAFHAAGGRVCEAYNPYTCFSTALRKSPVYYVAQSCPRRKIKARWC